MFSKCILPPAHCKAACDALKPAKLSMHLNGEWEARLNYQMGNKNIGLGLVFQTVIPPCYSKCLRKTEGPRVLTSYLACSEYLCVMEGHQKRVVTEKYCWLQL
jgi:hypothetical protein